MISKIADWYAESGKLLLLKILFVFQIINTILEGFAAFIVGILMISEWYMKGAGIVVIILGVPFTVFINAVIAGLILGEYRWCGGAQSITTYKRYMRRSSTSSCHEEKPVTHVKKPSQANDAKNENSNDEKLFSKVVFVMNYFGSDSKGDPVRIIAGTEATIIKRNDNGKYDLEYIEDGKKKVVVGVMDHYFN